MAALRLEDYIQQLGDPIPEFRDPEDIGDETTAKLAPRAAEDDNTEASLQPSSLRRRAAAFLDVGPGGKKTSRKELYSDFGDEEEDEDSVEEEIVQDEERDDDGLDEDDAEEEIDKEEERDGVDDDEDEDEDEDDDEGEEEELEMLGEKEEKAEEEGYSEMDESEIEEDSAEEREASDEEITSPESESEKEDVIIQETATDEGEKAQAVVQQLDLWDRLMEARIQLQKVVSMANRLPSGPRDHASPLLSEASDGLLEMNCTLYNIHNSPSSPRKRKADVDVDALALESHQSLSRERNNILTFWDEKTRLASKKFKSFKSYQTPVVKQVEQILSDRDRLVRRTQVIRDAEAPDACQTSEEVMDDNDFYQRLLKNLIESKASEESTLSVSASQWLEVQRLRGKKKKKKDIDTSASKGRKLRYNVLSKMVNILAPIEDSTWSEDARNEFFKNLVKMPSQPEA
ncbi:hypothetical protein ACOMHN_032787 [Nucella lapillus]